MNAATANKGRAPRADGAETRARILESAGQLFAADGYAETTSKAIAAKARVDVASINYHFGGRDGLYRTVLAEAHHHFVSLPDLSRLDDSDLPAHEKLGRFIERLVERTANNHGWHGRVLGREILSPSSHLRFVFKKELEPKLSILKDIVSEITGISPNDPALTRCVLSIGAPCLMLMVAGRNTPGALEEVAEMPRQDVAKHLKSFAMAGLENIRREYRGRTSRPVSDRKKVSRRQLRRGS